MYRLVVGPDGRVLKDLYFVKNTLQSNYSLLLMSDAYLTKPFINDDYPGWLIEDGLETYKDLSLVLAQAEKDLGKEVCTRLVRGWWHNWRSPLARGYSLIEAGEISIGELR